MITRRALLLSSTTGLLAGALSRHAFAAPPSANDPAAIVTAIYARAAKGKGDGGGGFVIENKAAKAKYLSKPLIALWAQADAHTPKGDVGPIDFDPVTNSQEPDVKSFKVVAEKLETDKAVIAVTIAGRRCAARPFRRQHHPLQFRARSRPVENRRYQRRRRRRAMVDPRHAHRIPEGNNLTLPGKQMQ